MNLKPLMIPTITRLLWQAVLCLCLVALPFSVRAQTQKPSNPEPADEVIRVKTELVQTDVTVVDKRGNFVSGLKPEQIELRVDARSQPLAFFDQITAWSSTEEKQLAAARAANKSSVVLPATATNAGSNRGRLIFFFVDDVHLTGESLTRARSLLSHFVENKMNAGDRVAVVSTSGQIGFLQQLTDNQAVLREAIARLTYKYNPETSASGVSISEVDANLIASRGFNGLFAYLVEATRKEFQMGTLSAMTMVKNRVRQINSQSRLAEIETLSRLESLIRSTAPLAGRKIVFFISDGFVMDNKRSSGLDVMQSVAHEADRVGAVVYTLGTRANVFGAGADASRNEYPDFDPRTAGRSLAESKTPQEPLETLADETGGRAYLNSNRLDEAVSEALRESSAYYLLAWRPDTDRQKAGKSHIDVVIKGRPDLRVRMRRHFFERKSDQAIASASPAALARSAPEDELRAALASLYPRRGVAVSLSPGYLHAMDKATLLRVAMQVDTETLTFAGPDGKQGAAIDVLAVALDDRGGFSSFKQKLKIPRSTIAKNQRFVTWNQTMPVPPGLYQVRLAVRDSQTGQSGSAIEWIKIPRLEPEGFSMSSLFLTEQIAGPKEPGAVLEPTRVPVDHRFARNSVLLFQTYVYKASGNADDVWISAQVLRERQPIISVAPARVPPALAKDQWRIPYSSQIALKELPPGSYTLAVTATDKARGISSIQKISFSVE
ncbi:MAG: hypothetical protein QOH71_425 [Blastocatellia bacterium]|jgi:VWFA-related protein|nr:hypothetical protein [Blastocatellia bacterium]